MNIQGKVWGKTSTIFNKNNVEVCRIEGNEGGYCSRHMHQHKYNMFFVESGSLKITIENDYGTEILYDITELGPGDSAVVPPGHWHKFEVLEDCIAYEIYWVELEQSDIERSSVGGIKS